MKSEEAWGWQWRRAKDYFNLDKYLFREWIYPNRINDFNGLDVLDAGCGNGKHIQMIYPFYKTITGVDLNSASVARKKTKNLPNIAILKEDITSMDLGKKFDAVYSVGVLHHTFDPWVSFDNLKKHVKPGGRLIIWVYSYEGNFWNRTLIEFLKKHFFSRIKKDALWELSGVITFLVSVPVYSIYLLPLRFLPFHEYFCNWRRLGFKRNHLNVFDKLNAPITHFLKRETIEEWFNKKDFKDVYISDYLGVSWRASGVKK